MSGYNQQPGNPQNPQNGASQHYSPQPGTIPNQQYGGGQPYYQQPPVQQYRGPQQWPHMKIGNWMITMLLMVIPIVNIILIFIWAFGRNVNPSKKTFFQASLIYTAIGILLSVIMWGALAALFSTLLQSTFNSLLW